ncbi:hypothetical protein AGLY_005815, partial [Aphis glycines]
MKTLWNIKTKQLDSNVLKLMQLYKKKTKRETKIYKPRSSKTQIILNYLRLYIISYDLLVNNNFTNIKDVNNIIIIILTQAYQASLKFQTQMMRLKLFVVVGEQDKMDGQVVGSNLVDSENLSMKSSKYDVNIPVDSLGGSSLTTCLSCSKGVPHVSYGNLPVAILATESTRYPDIPKSHIFTLPLRLIKIFDGLTSR